MVSKSKDRASSSPWRWPRNLLRAVVHRWRLRRTAAATELRVHLGQNDVARWTRLSGFSPDWDERTKMFAELIPEGASVIEFGAGRGVLRDHLPDSCDYTGADLVERDSATLIYDLNERPLAPVPAHDVAVFSGVLEYVFDIELVLSKLSLSVPRILASYAVASTSDKNETRLRRACGWVNDLTRTDLEEIFARVGYRVVEERSWQDQEIYILELRA